VTVDHRHFPILVVDDEADILQSFRFNYGDEFEITTAGSGVEGLERLAAHDFAVIVADQRMPIMGGTEFLRRSMDVRPDAIRIVLTGYTDIDALVEAVNTSRVYRYITKPWDPDELRITLRQGIELFHLTRENARLVAELKEANAQLAAQNVYLRETAAVSAEIVGTSPAITQVRTLISKVAGSPTTVLVEGETGTGKELVARAIHDSSPRRGELFAAVNCAALSEGVLESELFGHKRGAFTGADSDREGLFEVASGGTLFLDEVSETTASLQAKLLRVLQEREVRRVGENQARSVDVRVVAATNRRLEDEVKAGRFREDLYHRLHVFPIRMPPLRDRLEDVPALAAHLTQRLIAQLGKPVGALTPESLGLLGRYTFPGNVRELANELERAILLAEPGAPITDDLLSDRIQEASGTGGPANALQARTDDFERVQIVDALERHGGVRARVAEEFGITYRGLLKKMRRLGL
jgi:DNA-binding NtrC family response regulator